VNHRNPLSRRRFLRGFGAAAASLPFVSVLPQLAGCTTERDVSRRLEALEDEPLLVSIFKPNGVGVGWHAEGPGTAFTLSAAFAGLEARRDQLTLFRRLNNPIGDGEAACNHRQALGLWTGNTRNADWTAKGPSFDTVIGAHTAAGRAYEVLRMHCQGTGSPEVGTPSFDMDGAPVRCAASPRNTFRNLFGAMPGGETEDPLRASILDGMSSDLSRLQRRLRASDRARLESHVEAVRDLERRLAAPPLECATPGAAEDLPHSDGGWTYRSDPDTTVAVLEANADLTALALACGHTRCVTLMQLQAGEGGTVADYTFLHPDMGNLHHLSHARRHDLMPLADAFDLEYVDSIATRLEGLGVMSRSLIVWGSGLNNGAAHNTTDLPVVLVGDAGGRLRTGQLVDAEGRNYNDLVLTLLTAYGVEADTFGAPARCTGPFGEMLA